MVIIRDCNTSSAYSWRARSSTTATFSLITAASPGSRPSTFACVAAMLINHGPIPFPPITTVNCLKKNKVMSTRRSSAPRWLRRLHLITFPDDLSVYSNILEDLLFDIFSELFLTMRRYLVVSLERFELFEEDLEDARFQPSNLHFVIGRATRLFRQQWRAFRCACPSI